MTRIRKIMKIVELLNKEYLDKDFILEKLLSKIDDKELNKILSSYEK